ncbi:MAG: ATP-binding protein [Deltaproteobacteria bacterium]|nr:MAG: ATP-binding protein [Deltaproteobacteria bacterium]TMQ07189.1 MAG: ATP-binding protein [Deltaproteobacteria bacterium]
MPEFGPYETPQALLRDQLWRCWLGVEYQIRQRWALGALPQTGEDGVSASWAPENVAGVFRTALSEYRGDPLPGGGDAGASVVRDAYHHHAMLSDARVAATLAAGIRLPYLDLWVRFGLSDAQRLALNFAVMPEIDPKLLIAYRYLTSDPTCRGLDARLLAMLVYDTAERRADMSRDLAPTSPLLLYRLVEQDETAGTYDSVLFRRLRPAARLVQLLAGDTSQLDPQLSDVAELRSGEPAALFPEPLIARAAAALSSPEALLVLQGVRGVGKRLLLQVAAARIDRKILLVNGAALAAMPPALTRPLVRSILRECRLLDAIPVIPDLDDAMVQQGERSDVPVFVTQLAAEHAGAMAVTLGRDRMPRLDFRPLVQFTLEVPPLGERAALWQRSVPTLPSADAETLASRFAAPGGVIALAARAARAERPAGSPPDLPALDLAVRNQLHDRLIRLGRRLDAHQAFTDLVVDDETAASLHEIVGALRERRKVRERWGFRGAAGVSVLFSGDPGVGKTMSATVIARQLGLAIYEIDLSRVVSKWLGETEKNLGEVFDAAEPGHVVLLFNEADSLFGKRTTEVKSSNDRYANMETNYLLQRLERFGGLAILTTNLGGAVDPAFRRRFAYDVQFTFPDPEMRTELWRRAIPRTAEVGDIDYEELGERFELSGGFIKVAAERSAFQAAATSEPMSTNGLVVTIHRMYRERGKLTAVGRLE